MLSRQLRRALKASTPEEASSLLEDLFATASHKGIDSRHAQALDGLRALLVSVDESYQQFDRAQELRLRSLTVSSAELLEANKRLRLETQQQSALLESMRAVANRMLSASAREPIPAGENSAQHLLEMLSGLITERDAAHQRLVESESRYRGLTTISSDWYWEQDAHFRFSVMSQGVNAITGQSADDFIGLTACEAFGGQADEPMWVAFHGRMETRVPFRDVELSYKPPDRDRVHISLSGEPRTDKEGQFIGYHGVARNITAQKLAELRVREALALTDALIESMPMPVSIKNQAHQFVRMNAAYERMFNVNRQAAMGKSAIEALQDSSRGGHAFEEEMLQNPGVRSFTRKRTLGDGSERYFVITKATLHDEGGAVTGFVTTHADVTELKIAEEDLEAQLRFTNVILETSPEPMMVKDHHRTITYINTAYEKLFEVSRADVLARKMRPLPRTTIEDIQRIELELLANPGTRQFEYTLPTASGRPVYCIITKSTYLNGEGGTGGVITTYTDISELKRTEENLVQAKHAAEQAMRARSQFLANMSHEIRTPMNGVLGMANVLAETPLNAEQREYLQTIRNSGDSLLKIVSDILDFSKIEAGKVEIEEVEFDLRSRVASNLQLFAASAREKNLTLSSTYADAVPLRVIGDPVRISQALSNLLGNAIKFTESGSISVNVGVHAREGDDLMLKFDVRDTGIGISKAAIERICDPFSQEDVSTTRRFGGTGLGLTISRQLVELMGGELAVESDQGVGSCFSFTIKLCVAGEQTAAAAPVALAAVTPLQSAASNTQIIDVLLAEDNNVNQIVANAMLKKIGCHVTIARDGAEAVAHAKAHHYDVILMDCHMPNMDGFEATAAIRALEREGQPRHTIIAQTANAMEGDRESCLAAGMDDYLAKPINAALLAEMLRRWTAGSIE